MSPEEKQYHIKEINYRRVMNNHITTGSLTTDGECSICGISGLDTDVWKYTGKIETFCLCRLCLFCHFD